MFVIVPENQQAPEKKYCPVSHLTMQHCVSWGRELSFRTSKLHLDWA
jgi:hypothetical protein